VDRFRVTAGYVTVETSVGGGSRARIDIPRGADLPVDVPAAERDALLRRGDVEIVDELDDEQHAWGDEDVDDPDAVPEGTVQVVLDWVAGDKDKAAQALKVEQAADQPRSTLIAALQQTLAAGE